MTFSNRAKERDIRTIRQDDPKFIINDGLVFYPRAMIHISPQCPSDVRHQLNWALQEGYVKCVAHVYGKELTMDALR